MVPIRWLVEEMKRCRAKPYDDGDRQDGHCGHPAEASPFGRAIAPRRLPVLVAQPCVVKATSIVAMIPAPECSRGDGNRGDRRGQLIGELGRRAERRIVIPAEVEGPAGDIVQASWHSSAHLPRPPWPAIGRGRGWQLR